MKIYLDVFSNEEVVSDSFNLEEKFNGAVAEVQSKNIVKGALQVDIGQGNAFGGKNEDGEDEGVEDGEAKVNNVIDAFKYQETQFSKQQYVAYFKGYAKKVKEFLEKKKPERVADFQKGVSEYIKWVLSKFDDFQFYCLESYDMENHITLAYYPEGESAPTFVYILDGLREEKM